MITPDAREFFEERAAILEFEAGLARAEAERQAYALTRGYLPVDDQGRKVKASLDGHGAVPKHPVYDRNLARSTVPVARCLT